MNSRAKGVLTALLLIVSILFLGIGIVFWIMGTGSFRGYTEKEPWCIVELKDVMELGTVYEDVQAEEGYSFYEISYLVTNTGDREAYRPLPDMYYEGAEYDDVHDHYYWDSAEESWEQEERPLFDGSYDGCIPPGRTGEASEVLMIKQGVTVIHASYYPGYSDEEAVLEIAVP